MFVIVFIIGSIMRSRVAGIFTQAIVGSIIYFILLFVFKDDLLREILKRLKIIR